MKLLSSNEVIDVLVKEFPFLERELQFCCRLELDLEAGEAAEIKLTKKLATEAICFRFPCCAAYFCRPRI